MEGLGLHQNGQLELAQAAYEQVLKTQPKQFDALHLLGVIARQRGDCQKAADLIGVALEIDPGNAAAQSNRGNALRDLGLHQQAIASYDRAIALKPDFADAHFNRGLALNYLKQFHAAIDSYNTVVALQPDHVDAYCNRGAAFNELRQSERAIESYDRAIALRPDLAEAHFNRGNTLKNLGRYLEAVDSYNKAIGLKPDWADVYSNCGAALNDLRQYDTAIESYDRAIALKADNEFWNGARLHIQLRICDWRDVEGKVAELLARVERNEKAMPSFLVVALTGSLPLQRKAAEIWVNAKQPANQALGDLPNHTRGKKIRVGYFSADFRNHPVSFLTAELFETHCRDAFEVYAFSFGPNPRDEMRLRLEVAFDEFIDVRDKTDVDIAKLSRAMGIDIAVDLGGLTGDSRTGIFALRAAPIQVNYIGYPGTMGAGYMDYLIADKHVVPEEFGRHYSENLVYLPCFQSNDSKRKISDRTYTRQELGLPEVGFVFCCFNNNYKITPSTFDGWMRILKQVDDSVLFLYAENDMVESNLEREAIQRGVDANRLVFGKRLAAPDYLARFGCADLFLDTYPFNGGTTVSDALWAGLPVLTCAGEAFASRMAASLLSAIDLPELITTTQASYEALAIELATDRQRLPDIKVKLWNNRLTTQLFNTKLFTQSIEDAYTQMMERHLADLSPAPIYAGKCSAASDRMAGSSTEALVASANKS